MSEFDKKNDEEITEALARKAVRLKIKSEQKISAGFGLIAALGGVIIMPIVLGLWAGTFFDTHYPVSFSWRVSLTFCGFVWGIINAYFWIKIENEKIEASERDLQREIDREMKNADE